MRICSIEGNLIYHQRSISDRPQPIVFRTRCYIISRRRLSANSFSKMVLRAPYFSGNSLKRDSTVRRCIIQAFGAPLGPTRSRDTRPGRAAARRRQKCRPDPSSTGGGAPGRPTASPRSRAGRLHPSVRGAGASFWWGQPGLSASRVVGGPAVAPRWDFGWALWAGLGICSTCCPWGGLGDCRPFHFRTFASRPRPRRNSILLKWTFLSP